MRESGFVSSDQLLRSLQDDILAEGAKTDAVVSAMAAIITGFARLSEGKGLQDITPAMKSGTWEDFEKSSFETETGTWYTDEEHNDYFIPSISPDDWANADEEERAQIIIEALAELMR